MNLGKYIQQLLLDNEMVIVPGFGAFISEYKPAELHDNSDELSPPSAEIIFNSQIRNNDGLLVGFVAENSRSSHFDALQRIEKERDNIIYKLDKDEDVELDELGTLSYNDEHEIIFTSIEERTTSLESFGLEAITLKEEEQETKQEEPIQESPESPDTSEEVKSNESTEEIKEEKSELRDKETYTRTPTYLEGETENKKRRKAWLWFLVLIPLLAISVFAILRGMEDGKADKEQNLTHETTTQQLPTHVEPDTISADTLNEIKKDIVKAVEEPVVDSVPAKELIKGEKYYLISGSFSVESNALTYMNELREKGIDAFNAGKKGRFFCVGIGTFSTFEEAEKAKVEFMENNPGSEGWVWKK